MAKTRSKGGATSTAPASSNPTNPSKSRYTLQPESSDPPRVFILPKKATPKARIVSLLNPRYAKPTRYLVCPESGIYEFTRIAAPKSTPHSWLIESSSGNLEGQKSVNGAEPDFVAYTTKGAELYIATPVDPLFLVLPALAQTTSKSEKRLFLSGYDHLESVSKELSPHLSEILHWGNVRTLFEARMAAICDTIEAGDESMFRLNEENLLKEVLSKAKRMSETPLPPSMEEKFVTKALEAPVLSVKRAGTAATAVVTEPAAAEPVSSTPMPESGESQASAASTETTNSLTPEPSTAATSVAGETIAPSEELAAAIQASPEVTKLQRLRTAFSFICSSYIAPPQTAQLKKLLSEKKDLVDFAPLDDYLAEVSKLRQEAVAARSTGDYSRKRVLDEEEMMARAEKKRKVEEEDKRKKAGQSRGVKNLKKVNTTGMKKMSDFFKKKL
ncbi:ribonuclease H2, subunit B [Pseudomassariella vexata]|uniref:Ribonuclease H2 subunit B n=1 Tax=Pseudomassariella vexata TaxID=1141098 RepID=A0A1Y2DTN7_9PEZI|nr:ribonuclease H2, subunit B [Pseudomassariella vexata]ORY62652.1 ribonuclease H2, subunit B [Pseudomassariella vexata]